MNKTALLNYALTARRDLESQIALSLNKLGIYEGAIKKANLVGEYTVIEGTEETFPKRVFALRDPIIERVKDDGFKNVVEELAYTWFNRIIALRFMEVHDYFDHGLRVLTSRDGSFEPEILRNVDFVIDDLGMNREVVDSLKAKSSNEELYRYILFSQCNSLSKTLPMLFDEQETYMELLLPNNLLSTESVIRKITDIPEEDFKNDVEVIGWLYQFYNSVKKEEVDASKETITKDTLPAVTQLFTPDWIVRYMVQNSVGRIWEEAHPDKTLKSEMKYYIDDADQNPEVQRQIELSKYKDSFESGHRIPEDLKVIEPCCGSGHILVYVFDLLFKMYKAKGYSDADIPGQILKNNLFGLDVDKRAAQLSQFALMMKARSIDKRFFSRSRIVFPHVYEIQDSKLLISLNYKKFMGEFCFSEKSMRIADYLVDSFKDGKVIGSLLKIRNDDYQSLIDEIEHISADYLPNLFQNEFSTYGLERLKEITVTAIVLTQKYDVLATNPPYRGSGDLEEGPKAYFQKFYPLSKTDMFAMFMMTDFVKPNGLTAMINMNSWMFIQTYEDLRAKLLKEQTILSMAHLGPHAFSTIGGEIVSTTAFVLWKHYQQGFIATYFKLTEGQGEKEKETDFLSQRNKYLKEAGFCLDIPGSPISYWLTEKTIECFKKGKPLSSICDTKKGLATSDNERFLRLWHEVSFPRIGFGCTDNLETINKLTKWYPLNKGGLYRKWYGNREYVINWENDGYEIRNFKNSDGKLLSRPQNVQFNFKPALTWSKLASDRFSARYCEGGFLFDDAAAICHNESRQVLLGVAGFLNSPCTNVILKALNPTVNKQIGDIGRLPIIPASEDACSLAEECIKISKTDWDSFETSFDFVKHPLLNFHSTKLKECFLSYKLWTQENFQHLKKIEEQLNSYFIDLYGLSGELMPEETNRDVSVHLLGDWKVPDSSDDGKTQYLLTNKDVSSSLISYLCGCLFGRYSLERAGLAFAGGDFHKTLYGDYIDEDGILPIYDFLGIDGGLTAKVLGLIKRIWGEGDYRENIDFLAESLGKNPSESAEETVNRYLNNRFYQDHLRTYQKRPIYWMFSSGKNGAFKCLIYLHRYSKDTLARINTQYFLPRTAMYKAEHKRLENLLLSGTLDSKMAKKTQIDLDNVIACEKELLEYGQVLDHVANKFVDLDLDDGVKINYEKFQGISLVVDGATIKKDLLIPIK